jgi:hypothetical protein
MTILTVVRDVCAVVGVVTPTSVFAALAANRTMQEMVNLANEMAQRIAYDTRDWTRLKTAAYFTGDGLTTAWELPANYKRMLPTTNVWSSTSMHTPMMFIPDTDEWMRRRALGETDSRGEWTLLGDHMHIWPALGALPPLTASFTYLDRNCVSLASGGYGDRFQTDDDSFRLDERLLKLGMTWQWKAQKGSPYSEDMGTYSDALQVAMRNDGPAPIIIDRLPVSRWTRHAIY